jgi:cytochrome c oxidase assembly protein subunit 15
VGSDGGWLPFDALVAIHVTHRVGPSCCSGPGAAGLADGARAALRRLAPAAGGGRLATAQRLGNVVLGWPLAAAIAHTGGAAALVLLLATRCCAAAPTRRPARRRGSAGGLRRRS